MSDILANCWNTQPMEPKKPYVLDGQSPASEFEGDDPIARENMRKVIDTREALSGPLGDGPWGVGDVGPRSQESYDREMNRQERVRAARGGLPDHDPADWEKR